MLTERVGVTRSVRLTSKVVARAPCVIRAVDDHVNTGTAAQIPCSRFTSREGPSLCPGGDRASRQCAWTRDRTLTRHSTPWHLDLGLPASRAQGDKSLLFLEPPVVVFSLSQVQRTRAQQSEMFITIDAVKLREGRPLRTEQEPSPVTPARSVLWDGCLRSLPGRATCRQEGARCAGPFTRADTAAGARGVPPCPRAFR